MNSTRGLRTDHILQWDGCSNVRDLGGYPTSDGKHTRWRALVRSDSPCRLTDKGIQALAKYGVRTIVDLRGPSELSESPNPFAVARNSLPLYLNMPMEDEDDLEAEKAREAAESIESAYRINLELDAGRIARIISAVARAEDGCVLVACAAGKDRTGVVCALLLCTCGVPNEIVASDWNLSNHCMRAQYERSMRNVKPGTHERFRLERQLRTSEATMLNVLTGLQTQHGSVENYLRSSGVEVEDLERVRARFVEPQI